MRTYLIFYILLLCLPVCVIAQADTTIRPYAPELFAPTVSGAVCGFSADGKTIYFVREDSTTKKLLLYEAKRKAKLWGDVKLLPFSGQYNDYGGRLSADGQTLYFTSDRPGAGPGITDGWNVWQVQKQGSGWGVPESVPQLNSNGSECCPTPLPDGSLLFSADRGQKKHWLIYRLHNGKASAADSVNEANAWQWPSLVSGKAKGPQLLLLNSMLRKESKGMDDIYYSKQRGDGSWGPAQNLGAPVNTAVYEDGAIISPDGKWLIFCRHTTHATPSRVLCVAWPPLLKKILAASRAR